MRFARPTSVAALLVLLGGAGCTAFLGIGSPGEASVDGGGDDDQPDATAADADPPDAFVMGTVEVVVRGEPEASTKVTSTPPGIDCPGTCSAVFPAGQEVKLHAASDFRRFGGFRGGDCDSTSGTGDCTFTMSRDVSVSAGFWSNVNLVFVSSATAAPGSFDGMDAADAFCQDAAHAAGLPGNYLVWLASTEKGKPSARISNLSTWVRPDGQLFASTMSELLTGQVFHPLSIDEHGATIGDAIPVATDTLGNGDPGSATHCSDYASMNPSLSVAAGEATSGTNRWTAGAGNLGCDQPAHFYCFERDFTAAAAIEGPTASMVWVSKVMYAPTAGVQAADSLCLSEMAALPHDIPNDVSTAKALISSDGKPTQDRFDGLFFQAGRVQRPDGIVVAQTIPDLLAGGPFLTAINVTADRSEYVDDEVWTGGPSFDSRDTDCANWSTSAGAQGAIRQAASTIEVAGERRQCNAPRRIWCFGYTAAESVTGR